MTQKQTATLSLEEKKTKLNGIVTTMSLITTRKLTPTEKSQVDDLESRMEFRLAELLRESQEKEVDIKIDIMGQILEIVKKQTQTYDTNVGGKKSKKR